MENNKREGKWGLKEKGAFNFLPLKRGGGIRDVGLLERGGGLNRGLTVAYELTDRYFCSAGSRLLDKEGARSSGP